MGGQDVSNEQGRGGMLSVVIPVRDEAEALPGVLAKLEDVLAATERPYEVLVVDDGSTDGSSELLATLCEEHPALRACICRRNFGKSNALDIGLRRVQGEVIVTMDGDGQDDPSEIPRLLDALDEGADMVVGWKTDRCDPQHKVMASRVFNGVVRWAGGVQLHDIDCGLKAFRRGLIDDIPLYGELHRFLPVLAHWQGYDVVERAVRHHPRRHGVSKYGYGRLLRGAFDFLTVMFMTRYLMRPMHFFGKIGLMLGVPGLTICLYLAQIKLRGHDLGPRPLLNLGMLLVIMGVVFVSTGLLGEMIVHLYKRTQRGVPGYMVRETLGDAPGDVG